MQINIKPQNDDDDNGGRKEKKREIYINTLRIINYVWVT
jgi:hypothetical protein